MALNRILNELTTLSTAVDYNENYQNIILPNLQNKYENRLKVSLDLLNFNTSTFIWNQPIDDSYKLTPLFNLWSDLKCKICYISDSKDVLRLISNAIANASIKYTYSLISENIHSCPSIDYFLKNTNDNQIHYNFLAEQQHLIEKDSNSVFSLRLGALKNNPGSAFPFLFNSEFILLNINALKYADSPAQSGNNPSGLTSEELNQLAFMAGQSPLNKYFIVYGMEFFERDANDITVNAISQLLWYYNFGATQKQLNHPKDLLNQAQEYSIQSSNLSENIVFAKDITTGNWFHKLPFDVPEQYSHHQWVGSSYEEYLEASDDNIPYRLLEIYDAFKALSNQ